MRWIEKQRKIKKTTHSIIDKIADEIGLENSIYPEVYWIGKKLKFRDLKLNKKEEEEFESLQYCKQSGYLYEPRIILIGEDCLEHISEEASHFLHLTHSGIDQRLKEEPKNLILRIIMEMFGFFGSKLIVPNRQNNYYKGFPDIINDREKAIECLQEKYGRDTKINEWTIYQQGYGLGQKLYEAYISEIFPKEKIRELFLEDFSNKDLLTEFLKLKNVDLKFEDSIQNKTNFYKMFSKD